MIIKTEKKGSVTIYTVDKDFDDNVLAKKMHKLLKTGDVKTIIKDDADVYTKEGKLLLRFRKGKLTKTHQDAFYDNVIKFAKNVSSLRGSASGSKKKNLGAVKKVMSNIFGYFDRWTPSQKMIFTKLGRKPSINVRECRFNMDYPEQYKKTIPLIEEIDSMYAKLTPDHYGKQMKKAKETHFKIANTSFTTITTNVNFQTGLHTDKGDDEDGFGNLVVIEKGKYSGGETCLPQYGVGVDVRTGDILFMNVHEWHGNLPIKLEEPSAKRLSIVCYLRTNLWTKTKHMTKKDMISHNRRVKLLHYRD